MQAFSTYRHWYTHNFKFFLQKHHADQTVMVKLQCSTNTIVLTEVHEKRRESIFKKKNPPLQVVKTLKSNTYSWKTNKPRCTQNTLGVWHAFSRQIADNILFFSPAFLSFCQKLMFPPSMSCTQKTICKHLLAASVLSLATYITNSS